LQLFEYRHKVALRALFIMKSGEETKPMSSVPIQIDGVLWNHALKAGTKVSLIGQAHILGLSVGGGPIIPPDTSPPSPGEPGHPIVPPGGYPHPEHPIALPPIDGAPPGSPGSPEHPIVVPPPDGGAEPGHPIVIPPPTNPPSEGKPPPPEGGWGWHPQWGWGYFPGQTNPGPKA
jgi:hypothetical protein